MQKTLTFLDRILQSHVHLFLFLSGGCLFLILLFHGFLLPQTLPFSNLPSQALLSELGFWQALTPVGPWFAENGRLIALIVLGTCALALLAYSLAIYLAWTNRNSQGIRRFLFLGALLFFFLPVTFLPTFDTDIYNYITRGRIAAAHGANPYFVAADQFPDDPTYLYANKLYTDRPGGKLQAWMVLNVALAWTAGDEPIHNLLLYRLFFFLTNVLNLLLIHKIVEFVKPGWSVVGIAVFAWNPITALHGQSHTDSVMVTYLLLGIWLLLNQRPKSSMFFFACSVLVKLITAPLIAIYLLRGLRKGEWKNVFRDGAVLGGTALLFLALFWSGPEVLYFSLGLMGRAGSASAPLLNTALKGIFLTALLVLGWTRSRAPLTLFRSWTILLILFSLFLTEIRMSWYLITVTATAALALSPFLISVIILISFASFLFNSWYTAFKWTTVDLPPDFQFEIFQLIPGFAIYLGILVPLLLILSATYLWWRKRSR